MTILAGGSLVTMLAAAWPVLRACAQEAAAPAASRPLAGKLDLPRLGIDARRTADWADPIVGVRTTWGLSEGRSMVLAGDIGGISTSDQYSAEAFGLVDYRFGLLGENNANLLAGYRVLKQKYEDGGGRSRFDWDVTIHGPIAGLKITF